MKEAGSFTKGLGRKSLIVTHSHLIEIGLFKDIKNSLEAAGISFEIFDEVVTESISEYAEEGLKMCSMAADALASGSPVNNPRKATQQEIIELHRKAF